MPRKREAPQGGFGAVELGGTTVADYSRDGREVATAAARGGAAQECPAGALSAPPALGRNRASSNSTVHSSESTGLPLLDVWCCLDRVTFICRVRPENERAMRLWLSHSPNVSVLRGSRTPGFRQTADFAGVGVVDIGDKASGAGVASGWKLRFDFNPQRVPATALQELGAFIDADTVNYTRVDVAIDYARALGDCSCEHDSLRRYAVYGDVADCTGWTFGTRRGARMTRVYDKRREREDKGFADDSLLREVGDRPLWRVEVESRQHGKADPLPPGLFDGLHIRHYSSAPLNPRDYAMLRTLLTEPNFIKRIPHGSTRVRANALLAGCANELDPTPADVYDAMRSTLKLDLLTVSLLLSGGEVTAHAPLDSKVLQTASSA